MDLRRRSILGDPFAFQEQVRGNFYSLSKGPSFKVNPSNEFGKIRSIFPIEGLK